MELETTVGLFPKNKRNNEIKNQSDEIRKWEGKIKQNDLIYRTNKYNYDF